jgi:hypothetical protein
LSSAAGSCSIARRPLAELTITAAAAMAFLARLPRSSFDSAAAGSAEQRVSGSSVRPSARFPPALDSLCLEGKKIRPGTAANIWALARGKPRYLHSVRSRLGYPVFLESD